MKKISVILTVIILFGIFVVSCGKDDSANNNLTNSQDLNSNDDTNAETETATKKILPNVPDDKDYGGYEFVILANGTEYNSYWYSKDIYAEEETGDAINDAVFYRNRTIEEKYNITIKGALKGNQYNEAKKVFCLATTHMICLLYLCRELQRS